MKKDKVPQDLSSLGKITKEVCYATDNTGKYVTALSSGWEVKIKALDVAWNDIEKRIETAREQVLTNHASPLLFFMEYRLMDIGILADYTGFWKWQIKRHLKPKVFNRLSSKKLQKYATAFDVKVEELKNMTIHED
ncbi:hypothetical protein [Mucilaginibacter gotjawali]|uniref:Uncharacterized protein n=2 Tax=Mucilaginibacter gotjawali TaxID=1550579 RepID=A0A0X8X1Z4_9SPHI|nr:hypothetical protein [Mucilaginibacter gotjawali]MBB3054047.1 hypothetical protein [Mucilaginibacter gotjawali]BAU54315.1 hypothetical protein MgSA37_02489 [Mucilaginibacter gotjawali]